jgi:hypothetical protein
VRRITLKKKQLKAALTNQETNSASNIKKIVNINANPVATLKRRQSTVKNLHKLINQGV